MISFILAATLAKGRFWKLCEFTEKESTVKYWNRLFELGSARWPAGSLPLPSPPSLSSTLQIKERRTRGRIRERVHVLVRTEWLWREMCTWLLLFFSSPYNVTIGPFFPLWISSVFLSKHPEFVWSGAGADSLNRGRCHVHVCTSPVQRWCVCVWV